MTLPQPTRAFAWAQAAAGPALVCRPFESIAPHFFTTRKWSLGAARDGDSASAWEEVAAAVRVGATHLARLHQVHGAAAVAADPASRPNADIILSDSEDVAVAIQTADCVPLLLADRRTGAI